MSDSILDELDAVDKSSAAPAARGPSIVDALADVEKSGGASKEKAPDPTGTKTQNFWAGVGHGTVALGRGAMQLADVPAQYLESKFPGISHWSQNLGFPSAHEAQIKNQAAIEESKKLDKPLLDTGAGTVGDIAGKVVTTMVPLGAAAKGSVAARALFNPTTYKAAAASGALQGALEPVAEGESRAMNMGTGAVAGMAGNGIVNAVGRIARPVMNTLSDAHQKAVQVLEKNGISLDAAQKTGSAFLGRVRSALSDNPFTQGAQSALAAAQQAGYNRAVLKTIGEDATAATPEVMARADKRIGDVFKDVLNRNNVDISDSTLARMAQIQKDAANDEKGAVVKHANRISDLIGPDGKIPGQAAYNVKKDLDRLSSGSDTTLNYHARQLRSTLMDAIHGSLPADDKAAFAEARGQFGNMKKIEPTIDREGGGDISSRKLANVMAQKANRRASLYGQGPQDLVDLAHAGNMLLGDKSPNSGSVGRAVMQMGAPLFLGGAEGAYSGDWENAAKVAGAAYVAPKVMQRLINTPATAEYLAKGMTGSMKPLRDLMLLPQKNEATGALLKRIASSSASEAAKQ